LKLVRQAKRDIEAGIARHKERRQDMKEKKKKDKNKKG